MRRLSVVLVAILALLATGCSSDQKTTPVVVMSGSQGSQKWQLLVSKDSQGKLCLEMQLVGDTEPEPAGCGFDATPGGRNLSWEAKDGSILLFGPVSTAAVKVRVTDLAGKTQEVATQALPSNVAKGRLYGVHLAADNNPKVTPLDATGKELPAQDF